MALDYRCRATLLKQEDTTAIKQVKSDSLFGNFGTEDDSIKIHPMDSLLALIHCADDFLRQDLMARLAKCQLAIPFILPDPSTGQLTLPLWAMRSIVKEWNSTLKSREGVHECPIVSYTTPAISFIRFCKQEKSKSKTMNEVIGDSHHDIFFHRDCEGGSFNRLLGEGLVDVSWYLPKGKSDDTFPDAVMFLNLHGDARKHPKQIGFLSEMSFMNFALITAKDLDKECATVLKKLAAAPGGVVLLLTGQLDKSVSAKFNQLQKSIPKDKLQGISLAKKNVNDIKTCIRQQVITMMEGRWDDAAKQMTMVQDCIDIAHHNGITIDEDKPEFIQGQKLAHNLKQMICNDSKERMLPLQGEKLWLEWAKKDKEEHRQINRGNKAVEQYALEILEEKKALRHLQLQEAENLSTLMKDFIKSLSDCKGNVRNYFLQSLKLYLNELSRDKISSLQREYKMKRSKLHKLQSGKDEKAIKEGKEEADKVQKRLIEASLGLEHLLREVGQVYEALVTAHETAQESAQTQFHQYLSLPQVAAELLIAGYPMEVMDGNAAHVPIKWVSAMLRKVIEMLKDPKVFAISVLGLQSTGKSTLLNTAFGLQFNVSAGRCTRGAFMQMLPISEDLRNAANCDYVLVVDTEGLRAPEQDSKIARKHDNELATFVTGFVNATMINIYGETPGDMDGILQTVVHAFIRMRNVKLNPSCQFVYQNVGAVTAGDRVGVGRAKVKDNLDKMTCEAAIEERCEGEYEFFSDVIQFDPEQDSHRFPGLWKGDPPMAPVNPGYSEKALALKSRLVEMVKSNRHEKLSAIETKIGDFWNALVHENFIFSFKNTLETILYTSLEAQYIKWSWKFRIQMLNFEQMAGNKLKNTEIDKLKASQIELFRKLPAQKIHGELEKEMKKYFEGSEDRDMLAQWQGETENRLTRLKRELEDHAKSYFLELTSIKQSQEKVNEMYATYQAEVMDKVKKLVSTLDRKELRGLSGSEVEGRLQNIFDKEWENWKRDLEDRVPVHWEEVDIDVVVENSLTEFYTAEKQIVIMKLEEKPLKEWGEDLQLKFKEEHLNLKRKRRRQESSSEKPKPNDLDKIFAETTTECLFDKVEEFLRSIESEDFNPIFTHQLLHTLSEAIKKRSDLNADLTFTFDYSIEISLTACGFAVKQFKRMVEAFRKQSDPIMCLEKEKKTTLFNIFKNLYLQTAEERAAACTLCDLLTNPIKNQVLTSLGDVVFKEMSTESLLHFEKKSALKARILIDLGEDLEKGCDLKDYFLYLEDAGSSLKKWIERYTKEYCKSPHKGGQSQLVYLANKTLKNLVKQLGDTADEVTKETKACGPKDGIDTQGWLSSFCSKLTSALEVDNFKGFQDLGGVQKLKNVDNFLQEVKIGLERLQGDLQVTLEYMGADQLLDTSHNKPHVLLHSQLIGCCEQCPFCKEQCDCTIEGHDVSHRAQQHRSQCLGGYRYLSTQKMVIPICSSLVGSDHQTFRNEATKQEPVLYKDFHKIYPKWSIPVDISAESSIYWKWFVGHYSEEIAKHFGMKTNEFPSEWRKLTWQDAKKDMKDAYKIGTGKMN